MRKLKTNLIAGFVFVSILGSLAHFFYQWSGENSLVGLFTPVNESTWEHMKLLFFPALLYLPIASHFLKDEYPNIENALACGIVLGTLFIPTFFYTYSGILGFQVIPLDIASFFLAVAVLFGTAYKLSSQNTQPRNICPLLLIVLAFCLLFFTYTPPALGIFKEP